MGDFQEMSEVGVPRTAKLVTVALRRDFVGAAHHPGILRGAVLAELAQQLFQAGIEFALGAVAVKMERQIARRLHNLVYARRTGRREGRGRFSEKKEGVLANALIGKSKIARLGWLRL